ncbi:Holliday junction resolvase RuvX [Shimazuella kribbensis]|uniref:Holliday junction resolvase RuvX n=1 Tax=Shimazuella kribbensis TaxID=139808 RepID=UPI0003FC183A|nr:Holliday junction resolvase RuvX [Shimazuella kribbensis]
MVRILALDLGERRIGIALSDLLGLTAQGLEVIDKKQTPDWLYRLDTLIQEYEVGKIVIGFPRNMDGSVGPKGEASKMVAVKLEERYALPVELWDERLSTAAAQKSLIKADVSRKKRKQVVDQVAAQWILQGYLDANRGK